MRLKDMFPYRKNVCGLPITNDDLVVSADDNMCAIVVISVQRHVNTLLSVLQLNGEFDGFYTKVIGLNKGNYSFVKARGRTIPLPMERSGN